MCSVRIAAVCVIKISATTRQVKYLRRGNTGQHSGCADEEKSMNDSIVILLLCFFVLTNF